ncbi:putative F-box protein At1g53360 [Papaver somniferum]|uniref:putative F-box protein At1g53360 n=1 Tax=Papaver somniferum TaxID=3469 RepID=UPI000E6FA504|nr:putative F-box protein At1g53360 [Papaver somniferum]
MMRCQFILLKGSTYINPPFSYFHYNILGSLNGLVLLYGCQDHAICVCNPVTREYVELPKIKTDCDDDQYVHLFGYLPLTDEYKVVALHWRKLDFIEVAVCTLGCGNLWRIVGRLDYEISKYDGDRGVFANGPLHWVEKERGRVLAFDLTEEKFRESLSPPPWPLHRVRPLHALGDMSGIYIMFDQILECTCLNIWILEKKDDMEELVEHEPLGWISFTPFSQPWFNI